MSIEKIGEKQIEDKKEDRAIESEAKSDNESQYAEGQKRIENTREQGGFLYEKTEKGNFIYFLGLKESFGGEKKDRLLKFETDIENQEEMNEVVGSIQQTELSREVLSFVIDSYNEDRIPLLQSVPGTGKTYMLKKFAKLAHGKDYNIEYIACTPKTSELEIMGHWAPGGKETIEETKDKLNNDKDWKSFVDKFQGDISSLVSQRENDLLDEEEFREKWANIHEEYVSFQEERLKDILKINNQGDWKFHKGILLNAYKDPRDPEDNGKFTVIDEIDNLPENYQNILLQISGEEANLASDITTYSNGGQTKYVKGEDTFIALAANYSELASGKRSISEALADRVDWISVTPEDSLKDEKERIIEYAFKGLETKFKDADPKVIENLRGVLASTTASLHIAFKEFLSETKHEGIKVQKDQTRSREQEKPFSQRNFIGLEKKILNSIDDFQYFDPETGGVKFGEIVQESFLNTYSKFIANKDLRSRFERDQILPILYANQKRMELKDGKMILKDQKDLQDARLSYVEDGDSFRLYNDDDKGENMYSINDVLNILGERARLVNKKKDVKDLRLKINDLEDSNERLKNSKIPDFIKNKKNGTKN
ncbi:MAG: AAA family ATPase [Candidatus Pacebacteria bacterium]|nr:AAA family ATPase [Candidatus Paceibacterota bacterium]MDD5013437.1 AAA family ATPase [Candidatus Paceibacterota bacterium]MDD5753058.1 AAA family ATPase [Candidatus Paceibacterota bacterium]